MSGPVLHEMARAMIAGLNGAPGSVLTRFGLHKKLAVTNETLLNLVLQQREYYEQRIQKAEIASRAYAYELFSKLNSDWELLESKLSSDRELVERKIATAKTMAQAYAAEGIEAVGASMRAIGKASVKASRDLASLTGATSEMSDEFNKQIRAAEARIEFVRREILFELQAVTGLKPDASDNLSVASRIINDAKVDSMRLSGLRLNIGCGHILHGDRINVDARELPGVDVVSEATHLPFKSGEVVEIFSSHLLEHFPANTLERVVLPHWIDLLAPDGQLITIAPDGAAMIDAVKDGRMTFEDYREVLFGAQDYVGDFHYNLMTVESFQDTLRRQGFVEIETVYEAQRNGKCFEFCVRASKPR